MTTFAGAVGTAWVNTLAPMAYSATVLVEVDVQDVGPNSLGSGVGSMSHPGTRSGFACNANVCALLHFSVARRYRGGKPKMFLPYGTTADQADNRSWVPGFVSGMATAWDSFITSIQGSAWTGGTIGSQANVSYYAGFHSVQYPPSNRYKNVPTPRGTPIVEAITGVTCATVFGSQRRRLHSGG
jgi:hypothetical protein